jgi:S1-C subfamily serine protease
VRRVVNALIRNKGKVVRAALGVQCAADAQAKQLGLPGVLLLEVAPGSAAAKAGMRGTYRDARDGSLVIGDVILSVDKQKVQSVEDLLAAVEERAPGDDVAVVVLREGRERTLRAKLQQRAE